MDVMVSGIVQESPTEVFAFLVDLENWPKWQGDMTSTSLIEGTRGQVGARYRYVAKALGQRFDSTVQLVTVDAPREVAFEGEWTGMIRPRGRYLVEPASGATLVTLNPQPEARGIGRIVAPLMTVMIRRLNRKHLEQLRGALERRAIN